MAEVKVGKYKIQTSYYNILEFIHLWVPAWLLPLNFAYVIHKLWTVDP